MRHFLVLGVLFLWQAVSTLQAQEFENSKRQKKAHSSLDFLQLEGVSDSSVHSLGEFCSKGHVHGHFRNYFMATLHPGQLSDYWTNATGGSFGYESAIWKGFQFGIKGIFTYQTLSADLLAKDSLTGKSAKWERELYDVNRPGERKDLDRLEELFIRFYYKPASFVEYGKLDINEGPLLLRRDGRMKPFVFQGLWGNHALQNGSTIKYGWIHRVSPRGMTEWFSLEEAIGMNNNGCQPNGGKASYHGNTPIRGLGVAGIKGYPLGNWKWDVWNYYFDRMSNINWIEGNYEKGSLIGGLQYVVQLPHPYQKSLMYAERYIQPDEQAHVLSGKAGFKTGNLHVTANFLHAFGTGRFLYPRELGRENFFVSQSRSWMDGLGASQVYMLRFQFQPQKGVGRNLKTDLRLSLFDVPSREEPTFNKYLLSSFYQATFVARYRFPKAFKGMELVFLYVGKKAVNKDEPGLADTFYRSNLHHLNFVTNINF